MNENVVVSYSKYSTWCQCPLKYKYLYIDKFKEGSSEALDHGTAIHKEMEEYLKFPTMPLPICVHDDLKHMVALVKATKPEIEAWWTLNYDLKECGSWDQDVAFRAKIDFYYLQDAHLVIGDWKTGKVRPKNMEQLQFYAMVAFNLFPAIERITIELYFLEHGVYQTQEFIRSQAEALQVAWDARLQPFRDALLFPPNVTPLCGWCGFSKTKGGACLAG